MKNLFVPRRLEGRNEKFQLIKEANFKEFDLIKHKLQVKITSCKGHIYYDHNLIGIPYDNTIELINKEILTNEEADKLLDWALFMGDLRKCETEISIDKYNFIGLQILQMERNFNAYPAITIKVTACCDYLTITS